MDGSVNGNDAGNQSNALSYQSLNQILGALDVVYAPASTNESRRQATIFLDECKNHPDAFKRGLALAGDQSKSAPVRLYGLSTLEHLIKYCWATIGKEPKVVSREWLLSLAHNISDNEPAYLRNKVAQLWVELAERCWAADWIDMDEQLCQLWNGSYCQQEIVMYVLETLSDEVFSKESSTAGVRSAELGKACVEIFTPAVILAEVYPLRDSATDLRYGTEGWLERLLSLLRQCLENDIQNQPMLRACSLKILAAIRSTMSWMILKAIAATGCINTVCRLLTIQDVTLQMAAMEVLHSLYHRHQFQDDYIIDLVNPLLSRDGLAMLQRLYEDSQVDFEDLDESKYSLLKKLTEVLCALGTFLDQRPNIVLKSAHLEGLLQFLGEVFANHSLVVSVPIAYLWTKLLACPPIFYSGALSPLVGNLLETCNHRLLRYEALPSDCEDLTYLFLNEDFDTIPERHAFIGNYRRYCTEIVERIVGKSPFEAVKHIMGQTDSIMQTLLNHGPPPKQTFSNDSLALLRMDAQFIVVMSALKAYVRLSKTSDAQTTDWQRDHNSLQEGIEQWCRGLLQNNTMDPVVRKRVLQLVVEITITTQSSGSALCLAVCENIFSKPFTSTAGSPLFEEAVKDFIALCPKELQKLAMRYSGQFHKVYADLESSILKTCESHLLDMRTKSEYKAFLFSVLLRASPITGDEYTARIDRLNEMMIPTLHLWRAHEFEQFTSTFHSFCSLLGLDQYPNYFLNCKAHSIDDWSTYQLDEQGLRLRDQIQSQSDSLPLQSTRCFLSASTEKITFHSRQYSIMRTFWHDKIPVMLPKLLQLVGYAHGFNNPQTWTAYPGEMQIIAQRTLVDRVWQSGISSESRDDFFNRVKQSKGTLEGLASTVRAAVRGVRELSYWILHCMSYFGDSFYGHSDLPEPFARALFSDAHHLSTHQFSSLLKLSQALVDGCPTTLHSQFLPPLLIYLFKQLDAKMVNEWEAIEQRSRVAASEEDLDREMKAESVLRQLTHSAVLLASHLLNPPATASRSSRVAQDHKQTSSSISGDPALDVVDGHAGGEASEETDSELDAAQHLRWLILSTPNILEPIVMFCTHTLRTHDSRSCTVITRVLRHLIPEFQARSGHTGASTAQPDSPEVMVDNRDGADRQGSRDEATVAQVREFFSMTVLQACIESLHDSYFSEQQMQKDLAALIAAIVALYSASTATPRAVLLSLPGMDAERVDEHIAQICRPGVSERQQRAWTLALLENVRGVSISELGKIYRSGAPNESPANAAALATKRSKRAAAPRYGVSHNETGTRDGGIRGRSDNGGTAVADMRDGDEALGGLADLFG